MPDPVPAAPAATAPAPIVIPEMRAAPVVQAVPEPSAAPEPVAATKAAAKPAPRQLTRAAAPIAAAPVAAAAATPNAASPVAETAPVVPAETPPIAVTDPAPQSAAAPAEDNTAALGLGLLGLVALGGAGAYAAARRRRRVNEPEVAYADERFATPAPVAVAPAWNSATAVAAAPATFAHQPAAGIVSGSYIPPGPLPTGPALAEMFERMVRSAPDADNPFKSDKRRRARVRWLMKQHEYRLRDAAGQNAEDRFDFRTYAVSPKPAEREAARREVVPA